MIEKQNSNVRKSSRRNNEVSVDPDKLTVYGFNLLVEAKTRALVVMCKKVHPDWNEEQIEDFLKGAIVFAIEKEAEKRTENNEEA
jgi:hypothetical protein